MTSPGAGQHHLQWFIMLAGGVLLFRICGLIFSVTELGADETQYWVWSRSPAFGYFSKPPFIAWLIAGTTAVFGDAEWSVRLASPFLHVGSAALLFVLTERLFGQRAAFWAGAGWLLMPGVSLSSALATTDAPLLFFWSAALMLFFRLGEQPRGSRDGAALLLGASVGLGFLSKYAMIYFPLCAAVALASSAQLRARMDPRSGVIAMTVAGLIVAPNLLWNARNDFRTLSHTAANANWGADLFHPEALAAFLVGQIGVAGPILIVVIILAVVAALKRRDEPSRTLIAFSLPVLAIICVQALISRAHANWAAAAYPALVVLASGWAQGRRGQTALKANLALHLLLLAGFVAAMSNPAFADAAGLGGAFKRLRGWGVHADHVKAEAPAYDAIMCDDREVMGAMMYYARGAGRIVAWNPNNRIDHHYEAFAAFDPARDRRVLYVSTNPDAAYLNGRFANVTRISISTAELDPKRSRTLYLFEVSGYIDE